MYNNDLCDKSIKLFGKEMISKSGNLANTISTLLPQLIIKHHFTPLYKTRCKSVRSRYQRIKFDFFKVGDLSCVLHRRRNRTGTRPAYREYPSPGALRLTINCLGACSVRPKRRRPFLSPIRSKRDPPDAVFGALLMMHR